MLQFLQEPTCALHVPAGEPHMESCKWAVKGRPKTPQHWVIHQERAVSIQGSLALLGKLWLHPDLEFELQLLVL